ncbi:MAG TPA: hypothetical protein PKD19_02135 [Candidatus Saccharibacteria bacterium]|nr:hypothetical protein [Candidatus Saccharibacteria bacterium]HMR38384.1 hypothetical protein [Candidatus Saccharibacteria bacterium]
MPRRNYPKKPSRPIADKANEQSEQHIATCTSKRRFSNQQAAEREAEALSLSNFQTDLTIYHCEYCRGWHLTKQSLE